MPMRRATDFTLEHTPALQRATMLCDPYPVVLARVRLSRNGMTGAYAWRNLGTKKNRFT